MRPFLFTFCFLFTAVAFGQKVNVKKTVKAAEAFKEEGKFAEAADAYATAFDADKKKEKYAYEAGYAYFQARNYKRAMKYFRPIAKQSEQWPLAGFFYAKSMKAAGLYDKAAVAFRGFRRNYPGDQSDPVLDMAKNEIEGCEMAMDLEGMPSTDNISSLSINTNADEFAAVPFSEDIVYFTVAENGNTQLKRSQFAGGDWSDPVEPNLPKGPDGNTCHGAFSPDNSSFYFTVCVQESAWNGRDASCELYGTTRTNNEWSTPERLRDYLKMDGNTATHPTVVHRDGKEWLYFVSDRTGGEGGLDIWYTTREINSSSFDFTFPENAGSVINTPGDEFSPFYSSEEEKLYFSSNGHPSIGGFDVYSSKGYGMKWLAPIHQGMPVNSAADDYFFQKTSGGNLVFLSSNRSTIDWETTTDDNIFQIGMVSNPLVQVDGRILDRNTMEPVSDATIMVRELVGDADETLLTTQYAVEGQFKFPLVAEKTYKLEALAEGYAANAVLVEASELAAKENFTKDIYLHSQDAPALAVTEAIPNTDEEFGSWDAEEAIVEAAESVETPPVMAVTSGSMGRVEETVNNEVVEMTTTNNAWSPSESVTETVVDNTDYASNNAANYNAGNVNKESGYDKAMDALSGTNTSANTNTETSYTADYNTTANSYVESSTSTYSATSAPDLAGTYTNARYGNDGVRTSAPRHVGSYYKIQVSIELDMDKVNTDLDRINSLGRVDTEHIIENGWIRVLLADYFSKDEALQVLYEVRGRGYPEAFLVRYQDGYRKI